MCVCRLCLLIGDGTRTCNEGTYLDLVAGCLQQVAQSMALSAAVVALLLQLTNTHKLCA